MCGIVYTFRFDGNSAKKLTWKRYRDQKTRGTQGFGFITVDQNHLMTLWKRAQNETEIEKMFDEAPETSHILFHHRQPTSAPNLPGTAHPIIVDNPAKLDDVYFVVHNGIIHNAEFLKDNHEKAGFQYTTITQSLYRIGNKEYTDKIVFNDSEAFAIEVAQVIEGKKISIEARGSIAFVAFRVDRGTLKIKKIYFGRNFSNPLKFNKNDHFFTLTSEGDGEIVEADKLHSFDPRTKVFDKIDKDIGATYGYANYDSNYSPRAPWGYNPSTKILSAMNPTGTTFNLPLLGEKKDFDSQAFYAGLVEEAENLRTLISYSKEYEQDKQVSTEKRAYEAELKGIEKLIAFIDERLANGLTIKTAVNITIRKMEDDEELKKSDFFKKITTL